MHCASLFAIAASAQAAATNIAPASSLSDICTTSYVQSALPANGLFQGITIDSATVTTNMVMNTSSTGQIFYPDATYSNCNVTFAYSHNGADDQVLVEYWLPAPSTFQNRYLSTGGGGLAINSGSMSLPGEITYGAVAGITDGGFGSFTTRFDAVFLKANGTVNWPSVYMFGYQAHHELPLIGKQLTKKIYAMGSKKLYAYYQVCSEGGRKGWSQVQRYGDSWDGAAIGAPAFRFSFQQV